MKTETGLKTHWPSMFYWFVLEKDEIAMPKNKNALCGANGDVRGRLVSLYSHEEPTCRTCGKTKPRSMELIEAYLMKRVLEQIAFTIRI